MALDPVRNFAISRVATAPSPATSGTTLVLDEGDGALFPAPATSGAFNVVIYPNGGQPDSTNAEIVRVTARSADTLTIVREQEGTSARTIVVGDIVMLGITAKVISDLNNAVANAIPAGVVEMFAGSTAPSGYLLCDGSAVSRTTYSALFTAIGTTYGAGDGSTTFNVPNLKGKVAVGLNSADTSFDALGKTGGEKTHTLTIAEMPEHNHQKANAWGTAAYSLAYDYVWQYTNEIKVSVADLRTGSAGGGQAHNNLQPYIVLNYIIKT